MLLAIAIMLDRKEAVEKNSSSEAIEKILGNDTGPASSVVCFTSTGAAPFLFFLFLFFETTTETALGAGLARRLARAALEGGSRSCNLGSGDAPKKKDSKKLITSGRNFSAVWWYCFDHGHPSRTQKREDQNVKDLFVVVLLKKKKRKKEARNERGGEESTKTT